LVIKPHTVKSHFRCSQKLALGRALPSSKVDVVVAGGGVIGASVAYYPTCRKVKVTFLERGDIASGSSGACDGLVLLQSKKPGIHLRLAMESRKLFDRLTEQLPIPIEYHSRGGMVVIETEEELQAMGRHVKNSGRLV
jgi:glycine/D-amino acid oxidase-like deaminating enzyme